MTFRLHLESRRAQSPSFHLDEQAWRLAAARHPELAAQVDVSFGWDGESLPAALETADGLIASKFDKALVNAAPRLRWIHTTAAGVDGLMPLSELRSDILFSNSSGIHADKAGDFALMALLMLHTRMPEITTSQRRHAWEPLLTTPIRGKKTVVFGFGDIGQAAGRAARTLGMDVVAVTRSGSPCPALPDIPVVPTSRLDSLLPDADFVVIAAPLTAETRGVFDARRLALLPSTAGLINMARAPLVDYAALAAILEQGMLAGAVLDVFDTEPLPAASPLWDGPRVIVTPHISCDAPDYSLRVLDLWFQNFARLQAGKPLLNQVDRDRGY